MISVAKKPTLLFSAGKDSLACLLMLRPHWDKLTVMWANTGNPHDEAVAYMEGWRARLPHFIELKGNQPEWVARHGYPADVVPVAYADVQSGHDKNVQKIAPYTACCGANMWASIIKHASNGYDLIITGQRGSEELKNRLRDQEHTVIDGVNYWNPLQDWSSEQVFAYIAAQGEPLPPFYELGAVSSPDCWDCTAYVKHNMPLIKAMQSTHPEKHYEIMRRLVYIRQAVLNELDVG